MQEEQKKIYGEYTFVFDIDGTLCPIKKAEEKYEDLVPFHNIVEKMRYYKNREQKLYCFLRGI